MTPLYACLWFSYWAGTQQAAKIKTIPSSLLENLTNDAIASLYVMRFSNIFVFLTKLYVI